MNIIVFTRYTCTSNYTLKHLTKVGALQPTLRCLLRVNHVRQSSTNPSIQTSRERAKHEESHAATRTLPKTRPCIQRTRSAKIPRTTTMGSCNRTQERRSSHATQENICPDPRRTKSTSRVHQRTRSEGLYTPVQKPLCRPLLLHQKERRTTTTSPRL